MLLYNSILFFVCLAVNCYAQGDNVVINNSKHFADNVNVENTSPVYIRKIDSIARSNDFARSFANVYMNSMKQITAQIKNSDSSGRRFIEAFEATFAYYFLNAYYAYYEEKLSNSSEWKPFFSHPDAKSWQLVLLGVNTHINVDICNSLIDNFNEKEIRKHRRLFLSCEASINKVYLSFFDSLLKESNYLRFINSFTKGFAKLTGTSLLLKWRRRAVDLAIMYYHDPGKFKKMSALINKKKKKIDDIILRQSEGSYD